MKVAIVNPIVRGISKGYQKYLEHLIPGLANDRRISKLLVVSPKIVELEKLKDCVGNKRHVELYNYRYISSFNFKVNKIIRRFQPDVVFIPIPRRFSLDGIPIVTMIQNMEPLAFDERENPKLERISHWIRALETRQAIRNADRIIAISKFVQDFLAREWQIPQRRIGHIYFGVDIPKDCSFLVKPSSIREDLTGNFIFSAGSIRPARGLEDALSAMGQILTEKSNRCFLVIAGSVSRYMKGYYRQLNTIIQQANLQPNVFWAGTLSEQEMRWCYQYCKIFLMTSRVESCPNIALEAMAHGCLCIATNIPSLSEISEDATIFYPPQRPGILAQKIREVLSWPEEKKQNMKQKAKARAGKFSWDRCAEQTVNQFQIAIEDSRRKS